MVLVALSLAVCGCGADKYFWDKDGTADSRAPPFTVVTFNIPVSTGDEAEFATIGNRRPTLFDMKARVIAMLMHAVSIDIIAFQELHRWHAQHLLRRLGSEFGMHGRGREVHDADEYQPIFFRRSRFKLLASGVFWLSESPDVVGSRSWDAVFPRHLTWVRLTDIRTGAQLVVANTHLDHVGEESRKRSVGLIAHRLLRIADGAAIVIAADFNEEASGPTISAMRATVSKHVCKHVVNASESGTLLSSDGSSQKEVDYLVHLDGAWALQCILYGSIPESLWSLRHGEQLFRISDHRPVLAKYWFHPVPSGTAASGVSMADSWWTTRRFKNATAGSVFSLS